MPLSPAEQELRDHFFGKLLMFVMSMKGGEDPEVTLEAMIEACQMATEHLQQELAELRQEQAE
ncbi:hypothetical protein AYO40_01890 [Planctomycetaceae bacterium SCGC AG-212-D15]|nr:hypothetical protein AYO40_01890 [Planctomycetaceae bacterium SCGC AG-212-D15]